MSLSEIDALLQEALEVPAKAGHPVDRAWARRWLMRIDRTEASARRVAPQWEDAWDDENPYQRRAIPDEVTPLELAALAAVMWHASERATGSLQDKLQARVGIAINAARRRLTS